MKPKNLKHPFRWEDRHVLIQDRVWYVPDYYDKYDQFQFPGWNDKELFGNERPVHIEYCSGNGTWIVDQAIAHPEVNWVALEKRFDRVRKIWSKIKNHELSNLIVICGEAYTTSRYYFPDSCFREIHVNFPDPWPKEKHAKNRLIQPRFSREMSRCLDEEGSVCLVTDDPDYSSQMIEVMRAEPHFVSRFEEPFFEVLKEQYGSSYFEDLWRGLGRDIRFHQFIKKAGS